MHTALQPVVLQVREALWLAVLAMRQAQLRVVLRLLEAPRLARLVLQEALQRAVPRRLLALPLLLLARWRLLFPASSVLLVSLSRLSCRGMITGLKRRIKRHQQLPEKQLREPM